MSDKRLRTEIKRIRSTLIAAQKKMQAKYSGIIKTPGNANQKTLDTLTNSDISKMTTEELQKFMGQ